MSGEACISYRDGAICEDGFVQKPICHGHAGCPHCGHVTDAATPNCCRDELPIHYIADNGDARYYRGSTHD